ncbi:hypothetical protein C8R46DRAFT_391767 [Mycena filopes]|nr:hypothetical protein C8R46DRAFT_391767 [Mycena filopes]
MLTAQHLLPHVVLWISVALSSAVVSGLIETCLIFGHSKYYSPLHLTIYPLPSTMAPRSPTTDEFTIRVDDAELSSDGAAPDANFAYPSHLLRPTASYEQLLGPQGFPSEALFPGARRTQSHSNLLVRPSHVLNTSAITASDYSSHPDRSPTTHPQSEQSHVQWGTAYPQDEGEGSAHLLSPSPQSPPFYWRSRGSDTSSIRSASPSPSGYGFPSPFLSSNPDSFPTIFDGGSPDPRHHGFEHHSEYDLDFLDGQLESRGRLGRRAKPPLLHLPPSDDLIKFQELTIGDPPEHSYVDPRIVSNHSEYAPEASSSHGQYYDENFLVPYALGGDPSLHSASDTSSNRSSSLSSGYNEYNPFASSDDDSSNAGRSRSNSHASQYLSPGGRTRTRAQHRRRRSVSPYDASSRPSASAANQADAWSPEVAAEHLSVPSLSMVHGEYHYTPSPSHGAPGPSASSHSRQHSDGAVVLRPVATEATVRASRERRKNPTEVGKFVCPECGNDFTAKHNLKSTYLPSSSCVPGTYHHPFDRPYELPQ